VNRASARSNGSEMRKRTKNDGEDVEKWGYVKVANGEDKVVVREEG